MTIKDKIIISTGFVVLGLLLLSTVMRVMTGVWWFLWARPT